MLKDRSCRSISFTRKRGWAMPGKGVQNMPFFPWGFHVKQGCVLKLIWILTYW